MFCENCGSEIAENLRFCERYGKPTSNADMNNIMQQQIRYGNQPQIIVQQQKKGFSFFHFFVGTSIVVFGIAFICMAVFLVKTLDKEQTPTNPLDQQMAGNNVNEEEEQQKQLFNINYPMYCGVYKIEKVREQGGVWKNYNTAGEIIGFLVDFRNLYKYGSQTNTYSAPTITLSMDSIDLSSLGLGIHSINDFHYEKISGMDFFIDDVHGFAIFYDGTYLYLGYDNGNGAWQGECAFK